MEMRGLHSGLQEEMPLKGAAPPSSYIGLHRISSRTQGLPEEMPLHGSSSNIGRQNSEMGSASGQRAKAVTRGQRPQSGVTGSSWRFSRGEESSLDHQEQGRDFVEAWELEPQIGVRPRAPSGSSNKLRYQSEIRSLIQSCQDLGQAQDLSSDSEEDKEEEEEDSGMADTSTSCSGGEQGVRKKRVNTWGGNRKILNCICQRIGTYH